MAMDFPLNPTNGQVYQNYYFDSSIGTWRNLGSKNALSSAVTDLQSFAQRSPNAVINGAFEINQRAFISTTAAGYHFDRWNTYYSGGTTTISKQTFTPGAAPVAGYEGKNFLRQVITGQSGSGDQSLVYQPIEDVRTFAGQTVTVSFWAKSGSGTPKIGVSFGQSYGSGGSPSSIDYGVVGSTVTLSGGTSWTRYSATVAIPGLTGKTLGTTDNTSYLQLQFIFSAGTSVESVYKVSTGIQNNTFDIWGVQVEAGSTATAFRRNANSIQGELAACQRYYWRTSTDAVSTGAVVGWGMATTANVAEVNVQHPVPMRVTPTSLEYSSTTVFRPGVGTTAVTSLVSVTQLCTKYCSFLNLTATSHGIPYGVPAVLALSGSGYVGLSAEL